MKKENLKKIYIVVFIIAFLVAVYFNIGRPMLSFVNDHDALQAYISQKGLLGWLIFGALIVIQTLSTCIPGTPFYLAAGFVVGGIKGALICDISATIGNTIAFLLGKRFSKNLLYSIFPSDKLDKIEKQIASKNPVLIHAMFMLLPLPKDTYAWLGYYSKESVFMWIPITFICRFPHIFIYAFGGAMLLERNYGVIIAGATFAVLVYLVLMIKLKKNK